MAGMNSPAAKYCALIRREALGGRLFNVSADIIVKMFEDVDTCSRLSGQLAILERLTAGESARAVFESVKADATVEFAKFMAEKEIALKG